MPIRVETGSEHLAEFYAIRIMLSDCEEQLKDDTLVR